MRKYILALVTLSVCICVCMAVNVFLFSMVVVRDIISSLPTPESPIEIIPTVSRLPVDPETLSMAEILRETTIPQSDLYVLSQRLRDTGSTPRVVNDTPPTFEVGQRESFWVSDENLSDTYFEIDATLRYVTPHVYMWVQDDWSLDQRDLEAAAREFEEEIYPTTRRYFGSEWSPGIDNDVHIHVLHAYLPRVGGYFSGNDEYPSSVNPFSNEKEMIYLNVDNAPPATEAYYGTLAHEFQHMIHWNVDRNEDTWVNEGCAQAAETLSGYGAWFSWFLDEPDTQLTSWADEIEQAGGHYEASHLFVYYLAELFGPELLLELTATEADGMEGLDQVLNEHGAGVSSEQVFSDWLIANFLNDTSIGDGRFGYVAFDLPHGVAVDHRHVSYPDHRASTVHQFAADYIELWPGHGDLTIEFTGSTQVRLVDNDPRSGQYQWWSNRGDTSDMTLTRAFDFTNLNSATLQFWTWYDIEDDYDYAYVEVSADDGETWTILRGEHTTDTNPHGNSFGHAYTGVSGGGQRPIWVQEEVDLAPYVGQEVMVRFEYVTDDAYNDPGFCVDDIAIPELGYLYDAEYEGDWQAEGFIRSTNILPQDWIVQLITFGDQIAVQEMELGEDRAGRLVIGDFGTEIERAVLVVSALAPATTEIAGYEYSVHAE